jgi:CelD/BcsL family acetyltransferase involved in cellulose biosynthesis
MKIELFHDESVFERLHVEWNALLAKSVTRVPFLRAEYQRAWWRHRGGGEWPEASLLVAAARAESGELIGLAPLFFAKNRDARPALLLVGSIEISDYLDFIATRAPAEAFCAALLDRLAQPDAPAWDVLDLYNLPASTPTRAALARAAQARGWSATEKVLEPIPVVKLPGDWETYLSAQVEKKERQEIRRKLRRAESGQDNVRWYRADRLADVPAGIEAFMQMMALNKGKARFLTPAMRAQFRDTAQAACENGWLHLSFLEVNGEKAAAYLSFDFGNRLYVYNSAIDPRFSAYSAGWVLLGYLLQWAIQNRRAAFDFLRGGEDYKYRFGGVAGKIYRVQISRTLEPKALGGEPASLTNALEADFFPAEGA